MYNRIVSRNMENAWQFAKVYSQHTNSQGDPTEAYWKWAHAGWSDSKAHRYPMGRGARPLYSLWDGNRLDYIEARKVIYAPLYAQAVMTTDSFRDLVELAKGDMPIMLRDYDGYDHTGVNLTEVLNNPKRKMGHSFVLKMLLTNDTAMSQFTP